MRRVVPDSDMLRLQEVAVRSCFEPYSTVVEASISLHAPSASLLQSSAFITSPDHAWVESIATLCFIEHQSVVYCYIPLVAVTLSGDNYWVRLVDEANMAVPDPLASAAAVLICWCFA